MTHFVWTGGAILEKTHTESLLNRHKESLIYVSTGIWNHEATVRRKARSKGSSLGVAAQSGL